MTTKLTLLASFALAAGALAQSEDRAFLARLESTFERGGAMAAADFIAPAHMSGPLHSVGAQAYNDGLHNTYLLITPGGEIEVTGTPALEIRIREVYAIDYLRGLSKTEEFAKALGKAGRAKLESAAGAVRDPVATIRSVPKGASRFFGRIGEGMKRGASESEDPALKSLTGVTRAKAKLAAKLGVSPYSTNEELQRELDNAARAMAAGGLIVDAATFAAGGPALTAIDWNQTLQDTLASTTPEDLQIINRKKLFALGVERPLADEFLLHPWYSPWHETIIITALARIGLDPSAFLTDAVRALTPEDAFFFQRLAQILAAYHATEAPLRALRFEGGIVTAVDRDGTLVVPVSLDFGIWAEQAARRAEEFAALEQSHDEIKGLALWTDGRLSERLREELAKRNITFRMLVLDPAPAARRP